MRRIVLIIGLMISFAASAQVEFLYDFNNLTTGSQNLNGQDGWMTHYQTAGSSQDFDVDYVCGSEMSPDESIAVWYPYGQLQLPARWHHGFGDGHESHLVGQLLRCWLRR